MIRATPCRKSDQNKPCARVNFVKKGFRDMYVFLSGYSKKSIKEASNMICGFPPYASIAAAQVKRLKLTCHVPAYLLSPRSLSEKLSQSNRTYGTCKQNTSGNPVSLGLISQIVRNGNRLLKNVTSSLTPLFALLTIDNLRGDLTRFRSFVEIDGTRTLQLNREKYAYKPSI